MKRLSSYILLLLALSSQLGTYLVFVVQEELTKESITRQIAQKLPTSALVKIKNSSSIQWEEAGKEFYLNGSFYDIVTTEKNKEETWFYCINDTIQTQLYNNYTAALSSSTETLPIGKPTKPSLKFSLSYFLVSDITSLAPTTLWHTAYYNLMSPSIHSISQEVQAPPPKFV